MPCLVLHAEDPLWRPADVGPVSEGLAEIGLLACGRPGDGQKALAAGENFLSLIMFLGCSPQVALQPDQNPDGQALVSVGLRDFDWVTFRSADKPPAVRCPGCRTPLPDTAPQTFDTLYVCGQCGRESPWFSLDWRQAAAYASFFIDVSGIYPYEAVPSDRLLAHLAGLSGCSWKYFFQ